MPVLRKAVRNVVESEDASAGAHGREALRLPPLRRYVQAESALAETFVFSSSQHHQLARVGRALQMLLLHFVL